MLTRRKRWRSSILAALMLIGMVAGTHSTAMAQSDQECWEWRRVIIDEDENGNPMYGWRLVNICRSGGDGGSGGGENTCMFGATEIPCFDPARGWWSSSYQCYMRFANPQPPADDPAWDGHGPEDGAIYTMSCPEAADTWDVRSVFLSEAPELPSVSQLAQQAMESLPLAEPQIGIAPSPDGAGLVGLPVWMWLENTGAAWGPVSVSVPGPGITVTARGQATQVEWQMGDGITKVCDGPGTPYEPRYGDQPSPSGCGHVYTEPSRSQPGGRYTVTVTVSWHLEWWVEPRGSGAEDEDFQSRTSQTTVRINELQVVTS